MEFRRLRLQGFKSFVDPTEMVIERGLTGVVGPNGCGKSNLLEAFRWVMGESRARAMRGAGMDDVIFAGSGTRPARNAASVALVVDRDAALPPFADQPQLEISRRITREIGSAYTVNGKSVRARDVTMLFADASSGAQSPSLVRQGQIGELISARPTARRRILEDAAGIAGLYQRRHEAELKLSAAESNLAEVQDLIDALDGQIRTLGRQAAQAKRYRQIAEALRRAEAVVLQRRWVDADQAVAVASAALTAALAATATAEAQSRAATAARTAPETALGPLREEAMVAAAVVQRLQIGREQLAKEAAEAQAQQEALTRRVAELQGDLERESKLGLEAVAANARLSKEATELRDAQEGATAREAEAQEAEREATRALKSAEADFDHASAEAARIAAERTAVLGALDRAKAEHAAASKVAERAEEEAAATASAISAARITQETAAKDAQVAKAAAQECERTLAAAEMSRSDLETLDADRRAALAAAAGQEAALRAEVDTLETMLADDPVASIGIADMLTVEAGYEAALAAALGDDLLAPMDPEPDAAGWSLISRTSARPALPEAATPLTEHVMGPAHLAARLAQIGIVGSEQGPTLQADLATGQRLVSRAGDLWRWDGFCQPASDVPSMAARRMEQRNRLTTLSDALETASAAHSSARASQAEAKDRLAAAKAAEAEARCQRADAAAKEATADRVANRAISDLETLLAREERIAEKRAAGIADRDAAAEALANAESRQDALGDPSEAEANREAAHDRLATTRSATMAARGQLEGLRRDAAGRERRLVAIRRESRAWEERGTQAKTRTADLERRLEETQAAVERAASAPDALTERTAKLDGEIAAAEARVEKARAALTAGEGALREAEAEERRAERTASEAREHRARREAEAEAAGARQAEAASAVRESLGIDPDTLAEVTGLSTEDLPTAEAAEQEAAKLRRQREALGAVNLRAEADAEELTTEREGLEVERADLEAAIGKLRIGVRGLNREGRERLLAAFDAVNEKFGTLFRHLFGGGEARLILVDSEDPLEAGLEILCQPPGKKLSTLSLLSGGEQTLTALSLIFAVFLCNPAPICVLDEVDAPLDDANVLRFCNLLDEMVRQTSTRFLIITHHAITMSRMDRLYGVTMVEQGVSRLVSVDLTRAAEMVDG